MVKRFSGIKFGGKHSWDDFGITMHHDREIGLPDKNKITYRPPHSNNIIDFSEVYGDQTYGPRKVTYKFNIADRAIRTKREMNIVKTKLVNWLMPLVGQHPLYDDQYPDWYFLAEVEEGMSFKEDWRYGFLSVTFTCYSHMISRRLEGDDEWDTFNFEYDVFQDVNFTFVIKWDKANFKAIAKGKWVHIGDWATQFSDSDRISPLLMGETYRVDKVRSTTDHPNSTREYKLYGIDSWVLEQDIVEANGEYAEVTISNPGSKSVIPDIDTGGKALTIIDNRGGYHNILNQPIGGGMRLYPGLNKLRMYSHTGTRNIKFIFRKEML